MSMIPAGIEPATFGIVAEHLNHCASAVPLSFTVKVKIAYDELLFETKQVVSVYISINITKLIHSCV